jgi:hypothetical protein
MKEFKVPVGIQTHMVKGKWFEVNDLNHSAMNVPVIDAIYVIYVKFLTNLSLKSS